MSKDAKKKVAETPMMKQYLQIKKQHPDAILLFRVGDFYETFLDDAVEASKILGITLTRRANGAAQYVELAGFPHHALDSYLPKLIRAGKRVAVCDQLEDPKLTKKVVKRGITELVTPGVVTGEHVLSNKENNYVAAVCRKKDNIGIAFLDLSTGEFCATEGRPKLIDKLLSGYAPKEILVERKDRVTFENEFHPAGFIFDIDDWIFTASNNREKLLRHFDVQNLKGFGLDDKSEAITAAGAILNYLELTKHDHVGHITQIQLINEQEFVRLDDFTIHSLELVYPMHSGGQSLFNILDSTSTPMGARLLHKWIVFPLKQVEAIEERQKVVAQFASQQEWRALLPEQLAAIGDLERLVSKVSMRRITPREVVRLGQALEALQPIKAFSEQLTCSVTQSLLEKIDLCNSIRERILYEMHPEAPQQVHRGGVIAEGYSQELDEIRNMAHHGKEYLEQMRERLMTETDIPSLKIAFNNVFGYYIEVRNAHKDKVPADWIRKQTLVNAERYITEELKNYEQKILGAEERILQIETELFEQLINDLQSWVSPLQINCQVLAQLDVLHSFATVALAQRYVAPVVNDSLELDIVEGRHPVIEQQLPAGQPYIPNNVHLDDREQQIMVVTGPNMSGKSALLRQTALITLMAQIGSWVPAQSATIGIVDSIFTRVGASDNISQGESTFMVEMQEAANILNNLTERSLVLFDELGRGTSTFDGISIAWAIVEYIHNRPDMRAKTLFATHYHELNEIEGMLDRVQNFNVSAKEIDGKMLFLRRLEKGGSEHSFGIQVAKLAGMPRWIVNRASKVLKNLESERVEDGLSDTIGTKRKSDAQSDGMQMTLFQLEDPLLIQIRDDLLDIDINELTPLEALNVLAKIKGMLRNY